ncbi:MAG: flagellar filament capping protein FliD [Acidobacteriota bacterium]
MGGFGSFSGVGGGGLDVQGIVEQLIFVEAQPIRDLERQESSIEAKIKAFNDFRTKLTELSSQLKVLNTASNFAARQVQSSNSDVLTATADSTASAGTFNVTVNRLALIDNFASDATFANSNEGIGTGSFDLTVGGQTATISIDGTNNTLEGLRDLINDADIGARASIINDGSGYRLTVTSESSGAENAISISNNTLQLADTSPLILSRTHSIASESELDAELVVNGLTVTSGSNSVSGIIAGVTLNLTGISSPGSTTSITVSNDTDKVQQAIEDFVEAYNDAVDFINSQFTATGGTLAGEGLLRQVQSELGSIVRTSIAGASGELTGLRSAGIELQNDGTLQINETVLTDKLDTNFEDFQQLFLAFGQAAGTGLSVFNIGSSVEAGNFEVNITQAAIAASVTSGAIGPTLGTDETLTFTQGSLTSIISLASADDLATIVSKLNAQFDSDGINLTASQSGGSLLVTAGSKGSGYSFTAVSDVDGAGTNFGTAGQSGTGLDVAGTITDLDTMTVLAATGSGSVLTGSEGIANGLSLRYSGSTTGTVGTVDVTHGFAALLERVLESYTDTVGGPIENTVKRLNSRIRGIEDSILNIESRLELRREILLREFARADQALRQLSALQAQLGTTASGRLF